MNITELAKENCPYHSEEMRGAYYDGFVRAAALVRAEALAEPELNLNCKSVQARLATVWGYVKAEAVKQEPIAWACIDADGSFMDALDRQHGAYQTPLYAAPVDAKAIRAEVLEEAAKVCDKYAADPDDDHNLSMLCAAAIRGLK